MTRETLADRILTYSDALAAFSMVNALAFLVALAEPEIRCSIAQIHVFMIAANLFILGGIGVGLIVLRRFEQSLREQGSQDADIDRFWRHAQVARLGLVFLVAVLVTIGLVATTQDAVCVSLAG